VSEHDDREEREDESDGTPDKGADIPPTRRHESAVETGDQPPVRESYHDLMNPVLTYPDDGPLSKALRKVDNAVGTVEQALLVTVLAAVVVIAVVHAIANKGWNGDPFGHFKDDAIRGGTFAMALFGAAFATHQGRHLAMDLVSRRMTPRARLFLQVFLGVFVIAIILLLIRAGFDTIKTEESIPQKDKLITSVRLAWLIPIGGMLIIFHTALHMVIDIDYILRRKTPPEKMRAH